MHLGHILAIKLADCAAHCKCKLPQCGLPNAGGYWAAATMATGTTVSMAMISVIAVAKPLNMSFSLPRGYKAQVRRAG